MTYFKERDLFLPPPPLRSPFVCSPKKFILNRVKIISMHYLTSKDKLKVCKIMCKQLKLSHVILLAGVIH